MKLATYLETHRLTASAFAEAAGIHEASISKYLSGKLTPKIEVAGKIFVASGGAVDFHDHMEPALARKVKAVRK